MEILSIRLFGGMEIHRGDISLPKIPTKSSEKLFAYLVLSRGRLIHRDVLCGQFWGEQPDCDARKALRTALWRIRSVLEPDESQRGTILRVEGDLVGFADTASAWVDTAAFEECLDGPALNGHGELDPRDVERLERGAALYRGDFLEGYYDEWCLLHRDRLRNMRLAALERLVDHHFAAGRWLKAIDWGRQLLQEDPLREHVHRAVMTSHLAMGDRPSALRQYGACARALRQELDIEPMDETRRLYEVIRGESPKRGPHGRGLTTDGAAAESRDDRGGQTTGLAAEVESALRDLYALAERLEKTRKALWKAG